MFPPNTTYDPFCGTTMGGLASSNSGVSSMLFASLLTSPASHLRGLAGRPSICPLFDRNFSMSITSSLMSANLHYFLIHCNLSIFHCFINLLNIFLTVLHCLSVVLFFLLGSLVKGTSSSYVSHAILSLPPSILRIFGIKYLPFIR